MSTDVLSEVLRVVRLTGAVFYTVEGWAPWVAEAPDASRIASRVLPGAEHIIEFHLVSKGSCWAGLVEQPYVQLFEGDIIVFPQGDSHVVSSAPGMRGPVVVEDYDRPKAGQLPVAVSFANDGTEVTGLVCGFLGCDARPFNPLLATLPRVLIARKQPDGEHGWMDQLVRLAVLESAARRPGSECTLARLSELLFVEVVRRHLASLPADTTGWLAGLRDPLTGRTLSVLHDRPAEPWSLEELAREVGASRSMLAERFHHFVGVPPMQYLARWRMQLAAAQLSGSSATLGEIAERVGYGSEAAFSRAFKRWVGVAPGVWREGGRPDASFVGEDGEG